jgi:hypothetical protein
MVESRSHKTTVNRIAKKLSVTPQDEGVDIKTKKVAIEVESPGTVKGGMKQLQGHKGPVYIAGVNQDTVQEALEATENTTIGVMDNQGKIVKESTRK